jgi:hypothetical protein
MNVPKDRLGLATALAFAITWRPSYNKYCDHKVQEIPFIYYYNIFSGIKLEIETSSDGHITELKKKTFVVIQT